MLAQGLSDPYTRLITPAEFAAMQMYDISGVGLNISDAGELARKTSFRPSEVGSSALALRGKRRRV